MANYTQGLTTYLERIANRQVKDLAYKSIRTFLNGAANDAVRSAATLTEAKYPNAMSRDAKRRPAYIRGKRHLQNSWKIDKSGISGERPQLTLINTREKAAMLILGFSSPSVIKPKKFVMKRFGSGKKVPVLVYPKGDARFFVPPKNTIKNPNTVVRPVPYMQKPVSENDSIGVQALKGAFIRAADRRGGVKRKRGRK